MMIKEPTRYEQRIGNYMEVLQLSLPERKALWGKMACHKTLIGRTIKDIFLCDGTGPTGQQERRGLWVFTSDIASELRGEDSQLSIDFACHRDIRYVNLSARDSDLFSVTPNSSMTLDLSYAGGHTSKLTARGSNCLQLMTMFRKYFSRHLAL